ncbi:unnamed protein product [Schistocephalus solidus]|uniref:Trafficking kinesin-binding protein 1 n=1 Tax=Schistocephalus solidus TaxID=70667 RepID=A0A183T820_SCHSO|nr:unnamed protein product [Schistocephalus solidus]
MESIYEEIKSGDDGSLRRLLESWELKTKTFYGNLCDQLSSSENFNSFKELYQQSLAPEAPNGDLNPLEEQLYAVLGLRAALETEVKSLEALRYELEDSASDFQVRISLEHSIAARRELENELRSTRSRVNELEVQNQILNAEMLGLKSKYDADLAEANTRVRMAEKAIIAATRRCGPQTVSAASANQNGSACETVSGQKTVTTASARPSSRPSDHSSVSTLSSMSKFRSLSDKFNFSRSKRRGSLLPRGVGSDDLHTRGFEPPAVGYDWLMTANESEMANLVSLVFVGPVLLAALRLVAGLESLFHLPALLLQSPSRIKQYNQLTVLDDFDSLDEDSEEEGEKQNKPGSQETTHLRSLPEFSSETVCQLPSESLQTFQEPVSAQEEKQPTPPHTSSGHPVEEDHSALSGGELLPVCASDGENLFVSLSRSRSSTPRDTSPSGIGTREDSAPSMDPAAPASSSDSIAIASSPAYIPDPQEYICMLKEVNRLREQQRVQCIPGLQEAPKTEEMKPLTISKDSDGVAPQAERPRDQSCIEGSAVLTGFNSPIPTLSVPIPLTENQRLTDWSVSLDQSNQSLCDSTREDPLSARDCGTFDELITPRSTLVGLFLLLCVLANLGQVLVPTTGQTSSICSKLKGALLKLECDLPTAIQNTLKRE